MANNMDMDRYSMLEQKMTDGSITDEERDELMSLRTQMQSDSGM